ncbi:hypothetical protein IMZ48_17020 [Candidatus Bathyarchaeota archaeon]|nr:hypothetical protein [Candidatus Bathyarchaeota archaeon]
MNKPRIPTPEGFIDCECGKKNDDGCKGFKAKREKEEHNELGHWLSMRKWKAAGEDELATGCLGYV